MSTPSRPSHSLLVSPGLFEGLGEAALQALEAELEPVVLQGGQRLFAEGDGAEDGLYVLLTGRLGVLVGSPGELISVVRPGESVGEMALLSHRKRSASVVAIRDSTLVRISKAGFDALVRRHPAAMVGLASNLVDRIDRLTRHTKPLASTQTVALLPLGERVGLRVFAEKLAASLGSVGKRTKLLDAGFARESQGFFDAVEADHALTLYCGDALGTAWSRLCLRRADRILLVAEGAAEPPAAGLALEGIDALPWRLPELVLLQEEARRLPAPAAPWLARVKVEAHYHIRHKRAADLARLGRMLTEQAVGLVLSGGGARGFGHIGVIRALREADIPIDMAGGTSFGSIIAAGVALEWGDEEFRARMFEAFVRSDPLRDYAIPWVALTRGVKVTERLRENFGEARAEDLWRPFFAVASNLTSGGVTVQREGPVWRALRASIAIPGLLPAVIEAGAVLVDGAVMNNLPADIMSGVRRGPVIGVDVTRYGSLQAPKRRDLSLARRLFGRGDEGPGIVSVLLRAGTVGSDAQTRLSRQHADLVLEPPLLEIDIRDWGALDRAIEVGYRHAMAHMEEILRLCRPS